MTCAKNKHEMRYRIAAAVCLASVIEAGAGVSLALGMSVTLAVLLSNSVVLLFSHLATYRVLRLCGEVLSVCIGTAFAALSAAYFGLTGLPEGVLLAAAATASLILASEGEAAVTNRESAVSCVCFTAVVTLAGVIRELFGTGALFGKEIEFLSGYTIGVLKTPAGGMMVSAVLSAALCGILTSKGEECNDGH